MEILLFILGGMLGYWLYMFAVALANLLLGPVLGYRYHMISFYSMMLANRNGRMVPGLSNISFLPIVQLQPKVVSTGKRMILEFGPILPGGLLCAGVYYLNFFQSEAMAPVFVKTAIMLGIFLFLHFVLNIVVFAKIFGKGTTAYLFKEENKVIYMLNEGIHPKNIAFNDNVQGVNYFSDPNFHHFDMCRYYHALENNDVEKMS